MIRPVDAAADARSIAELEVRAWRWAYVDFVEDDDMVTVEDRMTRWLSAPVQGAFVAEVEGRVIGVVQVGPSPDDDGAGLIEGLHVDPAAQGAGVGTALYEHARAELAAAGYAEAVLWVFDANGHARGFFERRGWTPDGATDTGGAAPALRYRQNLGV